MRTERQLADVASLNSMWLNAAMEAVTDEEEWSVEQHIDQLADGMAGLVVTGALRVDELRECAAVYNQLDRQAIAAAGGDLERLATADYIEATARRIGHHSLRQGLRLVKTERLRDRRFTRYMLRLGARDTSATQGDARQWML
jgi:hypothetical protein